jgi:copper(I)-binding protein
MLLAASWSTFFHAGVAGAQAQHHHAASPVSVSDAWIRLLPGDLPLAGYFTLHDEGPNALKLTGAKSPAFKRIELHRSMTLHGMEKMKPVKAVMVKAKGTLAFRPGGYHLMMWRSRKLQPGKRVPVTLIFANGQQVRAAFLVKRPGQ